MLLWVNAIVFVIFGLMFLVEPQGAFQWATGSDLDTAVAQTELRAMYGGICVALGVIFGWCAKTPGRSRDGLLVMVAVYGGLASFRLAGIAIDGTFESANMWKFFSAEIIVLLLAVRGLSKMSQRARS